MEQSHIHNYNARLNVSDRMYGILSFYKELLWQTQMMIKSKLIVKTFLSRCVYLSPKEN